MKIKLRIWNTYIKCFHLKFQYGPLRPIYTTDTPLYTYRSIDRSETVEQSDNIRSHVLLATIDFLCYLVTSSSHTFKKSPHQLQKKTRVQWYACTGAY